MVFFSLNIFNIVEWIILDLKTNAFKRQIDVVNLNDWTLMKKISDEKNNDYNKFRLIFSYVQLREFHHFRKDSRRRR